MVKGEEERLVTKCQQCEGGKGKDKRGRGKIKEREGKKRKKRRATRGEEKATN